MTDSRPTGQYTTYTYDIFRQMVPGSRELGRRANHGYLGAFLTKDVHPAVTRTINLNMTSGSQLVCIRPQRQYFNINGQSLGQFDIAHQSPLITVNVP